ncbi:outer membrane beta-barrel protein [Saccharospirillum sp. MSK14-1]|uniref:outer membrane beta-barrel protein n=1 Tax=Saccharospirillum sp. MSK14-1 TaxID=1897632 RepID=UPI0013049E3A|nr:outer membrane beta-barrel protein [Saccharospirillum sp. MSK14-1]
MKKFLITIILVSSTSAATAGGFYIGTSLAFSDTQHASTVKETGNDDITEDVGISGPAFSVFGGYQYDINDTVFTAFELSLLGSRASGDADIDGTKASIDQKTGLGVSVLLGRQLGEGALFGRFGLQQTLYELSAENSSESYDGPHTGYKFGLDYRLPLNDSFQVQMGWSRTFYSEETYYSRPGTGYSLNFEPTESLFELAIAKKF